MVARLDAFAWTDLELKLTGSNFCVYTRDLDACVQAGTIVSFNNVTAKDLAGTDTAVVFALFAT